MQEYASIIGLLIYGQTMTRPDLSFAISVASRYMSNPTEQHMKIARQILRYLKATVDMGITFSAKDGLCVKGYSDSDFGGLIDGRCSTSGYLFILGTGPILWGSKRQRCVAASSTEAEYYALNEAGREALWIKKLLTELEIPRPDGGIPIHQDNRASRQLVENPVWHRRTKHIDIGYHVIRQWSADKHIKLVDCRSKLNAADGLTKALAGAGFEAFQAVLGLN